MTIKSSGLWCDICVKPILDDPYWNISINGASGHACKECQEKYDKRNPSPQVKEPLVTSIEASPATEDFMKQLFPDQKSPEPGEPKESAMKNMTKNELNCFIDKLINNCKDSNDIWDLLVDEQIVNVIDNYKESVIKQPLVNQQSPEPSEDGVIWVCPKCKTGNKSNTEECIECYDSLDKSTPYVPQSQLTTALEALEEIIQLHELCAKGAFVISERPEEIAKKALRKIRGQK